MLLPFFWRRQKKLTASAIYTPLLKLFKTTHTSHRQIVTAKDAERNALMSSPLLLSGPKSKHSLGISLHFIILPQAKSINTKLVWKYSHLELREALLEQGVPVTEADIFTYRLIDPFNPPLGIQVDISHDDQKILEGLQGLVTYQLLKGQQYTGTHDSLSNIYTTLAQTVTSLLAEQTIQDKQAIPYLKNFKVRNIEVTLRQEAITKDTPLDIEGKLRELAEFYTFFTEAKYLSRTMPQDSSIIQKLYK